MIDHRLTENGIIELVVSGRITKDEINAAWEKIQADIAAHGAVRLLEIIEELEEIKPAAFWQDMKLGVNMVHCFERVAVVSDHSWIRTLADLGKTFGAPKVRTFASSDLEQARTWLRTD